MLLYNVRWLDVATVDRVFEDSIPHRLHEIAQGDRWTAALETVIGVEGVGQDGDLSQRATTNAHTQLGNDPKIRLKLFPHQPIIVRRIDHFSRHQFVQDWPVDLCDRLHVRGSNELANVRPVQEREIDGRGEVWGGEYEHVAELANLIQLGEHCIDHT